MLGTSSNKQIQYEITELWKRFFLIVVVAPKEINNSIKKCSAPNPENLK